MSKEGGTDASCQADSNDGFEAVSYSLIILRDEEVFASEYYAAHKGVAPHLLKTLDCLWEEKLQPIIHAQLPMHREL